MRVDHHAGHAREVPHVVGRHNGAEGERMAAIISSKSPIGIPRALFREKPLKAPGCPF